MMLKRWLGRSASGAVAESARFTIPSVGGNSAVVGRVIKAVSLLPDMIGGFRIVDGHAHTYMDDLAGRIVSTFTDFHLMEPTPSLGKGTVDDLLDTMALGGIDMTVLANFGPAKAVSKINRWNLDTAAAHPGLIPLVSVYPGMPVEDLIAAVDAGAKGVKMHNSIQGYDACDPGLDGLYGLCVELGLPITLHCGEVSRVHLNDLCDGAHFERAVREHPENMFVLTHLAEANPETVFRLAETYDNIIFDTSIAFSGEHCIQRIHDDFWEDDGNAAEAFRRVGCDRVTFGSDYPYGNPVSDVRRFLRLDLTNSEKRMILGANTLRLYKLG